MVAAFFGEGGFQIFWVHDFWGSERKSTIGQKIWGNFSKICININKNLKSIENFL